MASCFLLGLNSFANTSIVHRTQIILSHMQVKRLWQKKEVWLLI